MEISPIPMVSTLAQPSQVSPDIRQDQRPTADAAALARDPDPFLPLPPSLSQQGVISAGLLRGGARMIDAVGKVEEVERTLEPYGVTMLPSDKAQEERREALEAREADTDIKDAEREAIKAETRSEEAGRDSRRADQDERSTKPEPRDAEPAFESSDEPMFRKTAEATSD